MQQDWWDRLGLSLDLQDLQDLQGLGPPVLQDQQVQPQVMRALLDQQVLLVHP